jgi:hypothetical protein
MTSSTGALTDPRNALSPQGSEDKHTTDAILSAVPR